MSTSTSYAPWRAPADNGGFRFGRESVPRPQAESDAVAQWSIEWVLKRNGAVSPRQLLWFYVSLCALSLGIAAALWVQGATIVMPFAGMVLLAMGAVLLTYAQHAGDQEHIALRSDLLTVERAYGNHVEHVAFQPAWVRVEPEHADRSLIELSAQGRRIAVGRFVRPELRLQLAEEFRLALRRWQQRAVREAI